MCGRRKKLEFCKNTVRLTEKPPVCERARPGWMLNQTEPSQRAGRESRAGAGSPRPHTDPWVGLRSASSFSAVRHGHCGKIHRI